MLEYKLPCKIRDIEKSIISTTEDNCYRANDLQNLAKIIYNSVLLYSFDEFELRPDDYQACHERALQVRLKYNSDDAIEVKIKYGFFGEVLLYSILNLIYNVPPLIARGHFYSPAENSETKGYDSYHLLEHSNEVELWFGEAKFHQSYSKALNSVSANIEKVISDAYLGKKNLIAIFDKLAANKSYKQTKLTKIIDKWVVNPQINLMNELIEEKIKLVYPILVVSQKHQSGYDDSIKKAIEYIASNYSELKFDNISIEYSIFFIFLPIDKVKEVKEDVISWIESKKPLMQ